jgi:2-C-methyl-D-erythritol 4-phosphate cytidylyltransferase
MTTRITLSLFLSLLLCSSTSCFVQQQQQQPWSIHARRRSHAFRMTDSSSQDGDSIQQQHSKKSDIVDMSDVAFIILAGGTGSRMRASMPKQFLDLRGVPILHYSLHLFLDVIPQLNNCGTTTTTQPSRVVLVLDPSYHSTYQPLVDRYNGQLVLAAPGKERQDSVENGFKAALAHFTNCRYVAIHDSARPLVTVQEICNVIAHAKQSGAAVLAVPCKATMKQGSISTTNDNEETYVVQTIPRATLWEVHTPQVILTETLQRGFERVRQEGWVVTDDASIVEQMGLPVRLSRGEYTNVKITTPEDMQVASAILEERQHVAVNMLERETV